MVVEFLYAVGFGLSAVLLQAIFNRQRGRSEVAGCLGGFLLGPIGIILALGYFARSSSIRPQEKELEGEKLRAW